MDEASPSLFLSVVCEGLLFYASDQMNTNSWQLHNQTENFTAVSSGNILGSALFKCPLLSNCGNLWTFFHQLPDSVHSRGVFYLHSCLVVTVTRQTQDTAYSPQGHIPSEMLKNRITERTLILVMGEVQYFIILHTDGCLQPWQQAHRCFIMAC